MTRFKNPRELEEDAEFERELLDKKLDKEPEGTVVNKKEVTEKKDDDEVDWKSRYAELRRHNQQEKDRAEREKAQLLRELEGVRNGSIKPPKSRDEINEWKETYPDFADVLDTWIKEAVNEATVDLKRKAQQSEKEKALMRLKEKHPDCENLFADQKFHDWLADQSQIARDTIYRSFNVKEAIYVLDRYKADNGISKDKGGADVDNDEDRGTAKPVKVRNKPSVNDELEEGFEFSESQIERETEKDSKWWDANEDKILSAMRRGKIKLDISGGAR